MQPAPHTPRFQVLRRILDHRLGGVVRLGGLVVGLALATRIGLLVTSWRAVDARPGVLIAVFAAGFLQDVALAACLALPAIAYLVLVPQRVFAHRLHRVVVGVFFLAVLYALCFLGVAEWFFWNEFETRFNFIAVDYLIYTREVLGNIWESYPIPSLLAAIGFGAAGLLLAFWRKADVDAFLRSRTPLRARLAVGAATALACAGFAWAIGERALPEFSNRFDAELARNGVLSFATAFQANRLDFADFYSTLPDTDAFQTLRELLRSDDARFVSDDPRDLRREIHHPGEALRYNVIQITVESLSSLYLGVLGGKQGLTPQLDAIAHAGLLFTNFHATGTRTVRGMESLTLSVPPTPGQSIVKRPHNENLFTLGSVFRGRGYDTVFFYGGYGYFDNMNAFFSGNGYRVVDRGAVAADAIHFANAWGAADEDLYQWVLQEADRADAAGQPFHHFVMTTSNHRPFTFPDGRIDLPSHSGRAGAVKYTDWAIGHFLEEARHRPWFDHTIFAIVADHCSSSAGRTDLPVARYEIPLILYAPGLIAPGVVDRLSSQIDLAPTLLGLLHWNYESRFFGKDVLAMRPADERAFVSTYEALGLLKPGQLVVLRPKHRDAAFRYDRVSGEQTPTSMDARLRREAIAYYQSADAIDGLRGEAAVAR